MAIRIATITIDCADPGPIARWWAGALGWNVTYESDEEVAVEPPDADDGTALLFIRVGDPKVVKNRLHLDLRPDDRDAEVAHFESLGAKRIDIGQGPDVTWVVKADPDGNEFCILRALRPDEMPDTITTPDPND